MRQDRAMRGFVMHLSAFAVVIAALATLNLYRNPQQLWFVWILAGWGIGVLAHGFALWLRRSRPHALVADPTVRGFGIHCFVYIAVNALLLVVNLRYSPGYYWFWFPLLGWGLGLAAHGVGVFYRQSRASH
jgi:hypothetical protein